MRKEDPSIDITLDPCSFSLDSPFKLMELEWSLFVLVARGANTDCTRNC